MGLTIGGLQSAVSGAAAILASLVGQAISALRFTSTQASGSDAFAVTINGARWHVGTGASDYFSSDGSTIAFAGAISGTSCAFNNGITLSGSGFNISNSGGYLSWNSVTVGSLITTSITAVNAGATPASAAHRIYSDNALDAADYSFHVGNAANAATLFAITYAGNAVVSAALVLASYTDDSATAGNRTVNKVRGKNAVAALAATCVITNTFVTANSQVICTLEELDATATTILRVVPAAGSFTLTMNGAATADTTFSWVVIN